jgi:type VI secretion system protein ImpH
MATESRLEIPTLSGVAAEPTLAPPVTGAGDVHDVSLDELDHFVFENAESIEFFQLVRLLHRLYPDRKSVADRAARPDQEVARFSSSLSLSFPLGEVARLDRPSGDEPPRVVVNFMGLIGPQGVLPIEYTSLVASRVAHRDTVLRDFLDIFHNRIVSLFYRAWEKTHFYAAYERGSADPFSRYLADLAGVGLPEIRAALPGRPEDLLFYVGLLAPQQRSAIALEQLLADYFQVEVSVVQFTGGWYEIDARTQCAIGEEHGDSERLGLGAVVGDAVYDPQAGARIRIGPLSRERYADFLPGGGARKELGDLVRFFTGDHLEVDVQLVLNHDDVPPCRLGDELDVPLALGWFTWLDTNTRRSLDPDDTVLSLQ